MRVRVNFTGGGERIAFAYDPANFHGAQGATSFGDTFLSRVSGPQQFVFVVAPGQRLYAQSINGLSSTVSVSTSEAILLGELRDAAAHAVGIPSRVQTISMSMPNQVTFPGSGHFSDLNNPVALATAPDWSPMHVTVRQRFETGFDGFVRVFVSEESDQLRNNQVDPSPNMKLGYRLFNQGDEFILAPNQTLYAIATSTLGGAFFPTVPPASIQVATTLFSDVYAPARATPLTAAEQAQRPWENLWQGERFICCT